MFSNLSLTAIQFRTAIIRDQTRLGISSCYLYIEKERERVKCIFCQFSSPSSYKWKHMILIHLFKIYILLFVSLDKVKGVKTRSTEKRSKLLMLLFHSCLVGEESCYTSLVWMQPGMIHACMPICRPFSITYTFSIYVRMYFNSGTLSSKENNWMKYKQSDTKSRYDSFYRFSPDRKI